MPKITYEYILSKFPDNTEITIGELKKVIKDEIDRINNKPIIFCLKEPNRMCK